MKKYIAIAAVAALLLVPAYGYAKEHGLMKKDAKEAVAAKKDDTQAKAEKPVAPKVVKKGKKAHKKAAKVTAATYSPELKNNAE